MGGVAHRSNLGQTVGKQGAGESGGPPARATDRFGRESVSELIAVRTPEMPREELALLTEQPIAQPARIEPDWLQPRSDRGAEFPLCRGVFCYAGQAGACDDFHEGCHHNVKIHDMRTPFPALSPEQFQRAFIELAIATNSAAPF